MIRSRLGIVVFGDRLAVSLARRGKVVATFVVASAENAAAALRAELGARKVRARRARIGLARNLVTVKPIDLPPTSDATLRQMVQFEIDRHVPYGADETAFDFAPLEPVAGRRRVLVAAAERRLVDRALRLATDSRIRPVTLTVATHDLAGLLSRRVPRHAVWAHRAGDTVDLLFLAGRTVQLSRSLPVDDDRSLAAEIRASLAMLRWDACEALWISGDDARHDLASPALRSLGFPVAAPPLSPDARRALAAARDSFDGAAWLATAVALGRGGRRLNLLPLALRPRRLKVAQVLTIALLLVTLGLAGAMAVLRSARDEERLARLDVEIRRLDADVASIERLRRELERRRKLLTTLQTAETGGLQPLPILRELTDTMPADAWLTTLSLDQNGVEMTGQAAAASTLIPLLENSPRLERVEFASPVTRGRDKEQFRIKAAWEKPAPGGSNSAAKAVPPPPAVAVPPPPAAAAPALRAPRAPVAPSGPIVPLPGMSPRRGDDDED